MRVKENIWKNVIKAAICISLLCMMALPVYAQENADTNSEVSNARKGVVEVNMVYTDKDNNRWVVQGGSGFLIGAGGTATTVITNEHVVKVEEGFLHELEGIFGQPINAEEEMKIEVVIKGDVTIGATYVKGSGVIDFAILELEQAIGGKEALVLGTSNDLQDIATQKVYALGFPKVVEIMADYVPYTTNDVYITDGIVSKQTTFENTKMIQHSCKITEGNSGGPLVNEKGVVVGINRLAIEGTEYSSSIQIDDITAILDMLQVPYDSSEGTIGDTKGLKKNGNQEADKETKPEVDKAALESAISNAKKVDLTKYTEETVSAFQGALKDAKLVQRDVDATQIQVTAAADDLEDAQEKLVEETGLNKFLLFGIIAAVLIIILIIVIVIMRKNKTKQNSSEQQTTDSKGSSSSNNPPGKSSISPKKDDDGGEPTGLLNEGAGVTTLLSGQTIPSARLIRLSNHETAMINKQLFTIGKEKRKVDFCISDNGSISRIHAEIIYKNGGFYIVDKNSSNFTFLNGNKVAPGQENRLSSGDRVKFSDEEFEFEL
ncbi:MAG: trypsin-like peptidase domain-containing protein [Lachnospiraceae bacterium]